MVPGINAELLEVLEAITADPPFARSEFGGSECWYCGGGFSNYTGAFKHTGGCTFLRACDVVARAKTHRDT